MKKFQLFALIFGALQIFNGVAGSTIECEEFEDYDFSEHLDIEDINTCILSHYVSIDDPSSTFSTFDSTVKGIYMWGNVNIEYLPINVEQKFPNLIGYNAKDLSLTKVSYANFKGLNTLRSLWLNYNKLTTIPDDAFDDLINLEEINLSYNPITTLNGAVFTSLRNLKHAKMLGLECADRGFYQSHIPKLPSYFDENCGVEKTTGRNDEDDEDSTKKSTVDCERTADVNYSEHLNIRDIKACIMDDTTSIDDPSTTITRTDFKMEGIYMWANRKIKYLPENVDKNFPNLIAYGANKLSLTSVSKIHFKGLTKLRGLWLSYNQLTTIPDDAFDDLISLEELILSYNPMKTLNGALFQNLKKLQHAKMIDMNCASRGFRPDAINSIQIYFDEHCGVVEKVTTQKSAAVLASELFREEDAEIDDVISKIIHFTLKLWIPQKKVETIENDD